MSIDEDALRSMLRARAARESSIDANAMVSGAPERQGARRLASSTLVAAVAILVFAVGVGTWARRGPGAVLPTGLWQSESPVGTGDVGSETCVAVELSAAAYRTGRVSVWWWAAGKSGCRTSTSGPMESTATLTELLLPGSGGLPERPGLIVELELELLPSGSELVRFTLDPLNEGPVTPSFVAYVGSDTEQALVFTRVLNLEVEPPRGVPAPTPEMGR